MAMDLEELRGFIAVVEAGSFLGAARALNVSRTTLRRQVGSLEARAGVPLLESARQGVAPTLAGEVLVRHGRTMMQGAAALLASIREVGQAPSGTLRCVLPVGLPPHLMTTVIGLTRAAYPQLDYHCTFSDDPLSGPLVDVDVVAHFCEDAPQGPWVSYVAMRVPERLIASPDYLARRGTPTSIADLEGHDLLSWQAPKGDPRVWHSPKEGPFNVRPRLITTDIHLLRSVCIAGQGIALVPDAMVPDPSHGEDALVTVLPGLVGRERPLRISVPLALSEIPKIKMIVGHVKGIVGTL